jgi:uncharacterized protein YndB with AHSA1/START domain
VPEIKVTKDPEALTMGLTAEFEVPLRRLWDAYADPRQIERFWGPPGYPARFTRHDMFPGGRSLYYMTGPEGEQYHGYWEFIEVKEPHSFEFLDGFAFVDGTPNPEMPSMRMVFNFEETPTGSRMTATTYFDSLEDMNTLLEMGAEEGTLAAMSQMDGVLADLRSFSHGMATDADILGDTRVRISRVIGGTVEQVWKAHNDADLMKQWLLGPGGWTMPVAELAHHPGDTFVYEWESEDGDQRFGFTGELVEVEAPYRAVTTERMLGTDGPSTLNEMTLTPVESGTLLTIVVTYPDAETRDMILGTGMTDGMEASYSRLEEVVLA